MAISATSGTTPLHLFTCFHPFQRCLIGNNDRHCINLYLHSNYLDFQRYQFGRDRGFSVNSRTRKILGNFRKVLCNFSCTGSRNTRRFLLGGALWQGLIMAGEGSSFSAAAKAKKSEIEEVLKNVDWPEQFPFKKEDFQRFDESADELFYSTPRFVTHIDDPAINALTKFYASVFPPNNTPGVALLDMCSSWISHYPKGYKQDRIVGMGMNEEELKHNPVLTDYVIQDLNVNPKLPFEDAAFDVITNVVSVDYLNKPLDVFKEMRRVLKPEGLAIVSFSNRCFWTKAVSIWTSTGDVDHVWIVGSYFHYAGGFEPPKGKVVDFAATTTTRLLRDCYNYYKATTGLLQLLQGCYWTATTTTELLRNHYRAAATTTQGAATAMQGAAIATQSAATAATATRLW